MPIPHLTKAQMTDLKAICQIIADAKARLKKAGSPQWQTGYPNENSIQNDIINHHGWVLRANHEVAGYVAIIPGEEPTYGAIDGTWIKPNDPYITLHRVAITEHYLGQGFSKYLFSNAITIGLSQGIHNFRVDTYHLNQAMQTIAKQAGFEYRGIIKVNERVHPERLGFELNL